LNTPAAASHPTNCRTRSVGSPATMVGHNISSILLHLLLRFSNSSSDGGACCCTSLHHREVEISRIRKRLKASTRSSKSAWLRRCIRRSFLLPRAHNSLFRSWNSSASTWVDLGFFGRPPTKQKNINPNLGEVIGHPCTQ